MISSREAVLASVRRSLKHGPVPDPVQAAAVRRRLAEPAPNVVPARGQLPTAERVDFFAAMVKETQASLDRVASEAEALPALAAFLAANGIAPRVVAAPAMQGMDWAGLEVRFGRAEATDLVSVTPAFCGVAETGTLVLLSGPGSPSSLNFLPDLHVVLVKASDVVGAYEEAWARLRRLPAMPRTVNWITGPSRTADIEQTLLLGAHGPRRLHVILVDDLGEGS